MTPLLTFENEYAALPPRFYARVHPVPVRNPTLIRYNDGLAQLLQAHDRLPADVEVLSGNRVPEGADPIAMAYAGHQFGGFVPQLGDGRAVLLGQVRDATGQSWDVQLKGSGPTPFSRGGDGRAWIGPVLREYVVSEAMHALGIPTTRALAAVATGQPVYRQQVQPGAVLTRIARSHIRVGTFEYFAARQDTDALRILVDHVFEHHLPAPAGDQLPALALIAEVGRRQAALIAKWLSVGFIHGVMNTDNSSITGDTIDYGPCAFLDDYSANKVFSSIDRRGRYAYANQPIIGQWNLASLARALMPLFDHEQAHIDEAQAIIDAFPEQFAAAHLVHKRAKLGLTEPQEGDEALYDDLLQRMADNHADFTNTFRALSHLEHAVGEADERARAVFDHPAGFDAWAGKWRARLASEGSVDAERHERMRRTNPAYIPRNHRIEEMIQAAVAGDFAPLDALSAVLSEPFTEYPDQAAYAEPPQEHEVVHQTFCGT